MFFKRNKNGSLELSVNAIVIIVLAITMLGLGLGFLRGMFGKSIGEVESSLDSLGQQRRADLISQCEQELCMEKMSLNMKKNEEQMNNMVIYNKFDCDLSNVVIKIGSKEGGSKSFGENDCQYIGEGPNCEDIMMETYKTTTVTSKEKKAIVVVISVKNTAKNTVYTYPVSISGQCTYDGETFVLSKTGYVDINVEG
jgi:hypothetical protein